MRCTANSLETCFKYSFTLLLTLGLFCYPLTARVLGASPSASIILSAPPSNITDITASENFTYNAVPEDGLWLPRPRHLFRRAGDHKQPSPANDAQLADATSKGCNLLYMMAVSADNTLKRWQITSKTTIITSSQSRWTNAGDLKTYGWSDTKGPTNWAYAGVDDVMKALGIDKTNTKATYNVQLSQNQDVKVQGTSYKKSGGTYNQNINTDAGLIMPYYIYSPSYEGKINNVPGPYVPLAQYSDVIFLYWSKLCGRLGGSVCNLKNFLFLNVQNANTWAVVLKALQNKNGKIDIPEWPGTEFSMSTAEGKALLATQIGTPLAWFLIQHKAQLGASKIVTKVIVFRNKSMTNRDTNQPYPSMLFHVTDGPADTHCSAEDQCCCPNVN